MVDLIMQSSFPRWSPSKNNIHLDKITMVDLIMQSSFPRLPEVSLLQVVTATNGGVFRLSMAELEDVGGEGKSAKGKRGHP